MGLRPSLRPSFYSVTKLQDSLKKNVTKTKLDEFSKRNTFWNSFLMEYFIKFEKINEKLKKDY